MSGAVLANWPIALLIVLVIVGVPLWLTFRRKHVTPDYRDARAHREATESGTVTRDHVPADKVSSLDGLTVPREHRDGTR